VQRISQCAPHKYAKHKFFLRTKGSCSTGAKYKCRYCVISDVLRSNAVRGVLSFAWDVAVMMPLQCLLFLCRVLPDPGQLSDAVKIVFFFNTWKV
jgi:hypothetical protein